MASPHDKFCTVGGATMDSHAWVYTFSLETNYGLGLVGWYSPEVSKILHLVGWEIWHTCVGICICLLCGVTMCLKAFFCPKCGKGIRCYKQFIRKQFIGKVHLREEGHNRA